MISLKADIASIVRLLYSDEAKFKLLAVNELTKRTLRRKYIVLTEVEETKEEELYHEGGITGLVDILSSSQPDTDIPYKERSFILLDQH